VTVDPEHNALWKTTGQSVSVLPDMLETLRFPANQWAVRVTMTAEIEKCVLTGTVSTLAWFKTPVVDLPNATQPATKPCVGVFLDMKVIRSYLVKLSDVDKIQNVL
jgi:hypothetical protein